MVPRPRRASSRRVHGAVNAAAGGGGWPARGRGSDHVVAFGVAVRKRGVYTCFQGTQKTASNMIFERASYGPQYY